MNLWRMRKFVSLILYICNNYYFLKYYLCKKIDLEMYFTVYILSYYIIMLHELIGNNIFKNK